MKKLNDAQRGYNDRLKNKELDTNESKEYQDGWWECYYEDQSDPKRWNVDPIINTYAHTDHKD